VDVREMRDENDESEKGYGESQQAFSKEHVQQP
jgi:hypothetical protein